MTWIWSLPGTLILLCSTLTTNGHFIFIQVITYSGIQQTEIFVYSTLELKQERKIPANISIQLSSDWITGYSTFPLPTFKSNILTIFALDSERNQTKLCKYTHHALYVAVILSASKMCSHILQKNQFLLLIEDDIHFIHACQHPTTTTTSTAWHMCTGLLDVQEKIPVVSLPSDINRLHRTVPVTMKNGAVKQCRGGVDVKSILDKFSSTLHDFLVSSYLTTLPTEYRRLDMTNIRQSCENLRLKKKNDNVK